MRRRAIIALVFIVAGAVLVESWHAAMNAAATGGRPWPWLWPATLEAFIAVLVLVYWDARSTRRKAPMARVLLALTTVVASAVQILDAPQSWLGWLTAGWTPVALLLSVEFAVWLLYGAEARPDWPPPQPPAKQPEEPQQPQDATAGSRRSYPPLSDAEMQQVLQLMQRGRSRTAAAREAGLDRNRVAAYVPVRSSNGDAP